MSTFTQFTRLSNYLINGYKTVLHGRTSVIITPQICNYAKSAEERLGIEKPKRPLTPFFKFMAQMRPALLAKNPGITSKEAIVWSSKHWQELDAGTKAQMAKEYEKDLEDYRKIKEIYESSLTEEQKEEISRLKEEMAAAKEKRKLKAEYKELGRPKKPMSSYFLYIKSRNDIFQGKQLKEYQKKIREDWLKLPESEKLKYEKQAQQLMEKYRKDIEAWELKMISIGRTDLVKTKSVKVKKTASSKKKE
ncbi:transcription factor A, mitochondrial [Amyelois transitella]|uniref:transcription factor A, mitochondrial n=1 Tax=Amyelois transitella TaxID=680683 RepID=UPI00067B34CB|nr:transcription factor A, mitochondrial [Amyelois transitella]